MTAIALLLGFGCVSDGVAEEVRGHCTRLAELRVIPFRRGETDDEVYLALMKEGRGAVTCLVERITDTTEMKDPREAPPVYFVVGDAAVMMLTEITGISIKECLPEEFASKWRDKGIYSYFSYVWKSKSNRQELQRCWLEHVEEWLKH